MSKLSVVVPIYNVGKYIEQCLESLCQQTLKDIEILCIVDGSTDASQSIAENIALRDSRIQVIVKENTGYGDTVNTGLRLAKGKYVGIVESDDFVEPQMFEHLYQIAEEYQAEVVKSNFYAFFTEKNEKIYVDKMEGLPCNTLIRGKDAVYPFSSGIWSGLYKRQFLLEKDIWVLDTPGASFQDTGFLFKVMMCANRVVLISDPLLNYRSDNENSSVKNCNKIFSVCNEFDELERFIKAYGYEEMYPVLAKERFYKYQWNFDRMDKDGKNAFLCKMYVDLKKDFYHGYWNKDFWTDEEWTYAHRLIFDFHTFSKELFGERKMKLSVEIQSECLKEILNNCNKKYIYGAGIRGKRLVSLLQEKGISVNNVIVTSKEQNATNVNGIKVIDINEAIKNCKGSLIILAVSDKYKLDVVSKLKEEKLFDNIIYDYDVLSAIDNNWS